MNENKLNGKQDFLDDNIAELQIVISTMGKIVEESQRKIESIENNIKGMWKAILQAQEQHLTLQKRFYELRGRVDKMGGI